MKKKKEYLLIVGANIELVEFYIEAKKMGLNIIGIDKNPNSVAFRHADKKIISSTRNTDAAVKKVLEFSKKNKIIGVATSSHDVPFTLAKIAKTLNLKSISIKNALIASDKRKMKDFFIENKLSTSKYFLCKSFKEFSKKKIKLPIIIKPVDGRGSRGVTYHENLYQIKWALNYAKENSKYNEVLVEEYMDGRQLSAEGFVYKKKYYQSAISDRNYSNLPITKPFIVECGGQLPSTISNKIENKVNKFCSKVAKCLDLESGPIKFDLVINKNEIKCIEFALRLSGGFFSSLQIPKVYNVNLMKLTILNSIKKAIPINYLLPKKKGAMVVKYILAHKKGKYLGLKNIKMLENKKKVFYFKILAKKNSQVDITQHNAARLATFACYDRSLKLATKKANLIESKVKAIII